MQDSELQRYKNMLLDMRPHLTDEIGRSIETIDQEIHVPGEDTKEACEGLDKELALEKSQEDILNAVPAALDRIAAGTYGQCQECGEPISSERLDAIPYAAYCVKCEQEQEKMV